MALRPNEVREIRRTFTKMMAATLDTKESVYAEIAQDWRVHPRTIERIVLRQTFQNVED